jgi:multidrug resistance efflux pump
MVARPTPTALRNARSVGFPNSNHGGNKPPQHVQTQPPASSFRASSAAHPTPLKKAPKGRWFVSGVLLSLVGFIVLSLWSEFGRYQAYGEIEGTVIRLSPSASGRISSINFREGDIVRAGQLIAVVDSLDLRMNLRRLKSELQIACANLRVRTAEIRERYEDRHSDVIDRRVTFYRLSGELHSKQAKLEEITSTFQTNQTLRTNNIISDFEFAASKAIYDGLRLEVQDLQAAVAVLEPEVKSHHPDNMAELLQTEQGRIADIQSEIAEVEAMMEATMIKAPVDGKIVKRRCHAGEYVDAKTAVVDLLETGSVEAVVYLPQRKAGMLAAGDTIELAVSPLRKMQTFRVERISPELVPPPLALQSNYRAFKGLVRVRAIPLESSNDLSSYVGAEIALPRFAYRVTPSPAANTRLTYAKPKGEEK